jgi:Zn-finger nucleic acid-binding protein
MPPGALHCPSCGAAASPQASRCPYCASALAQVACPSCFGMGFVGSRHCAHCGARGVELRDEGVGRERELRCPRCVDRPGLEQHTLGPLAVDRCPGCTGVFVRERELEDTLRQIDEAAVLAHEIPHDDHPRPRDEVRYLPCAACSDLMLRINYGRRSGVIVDRCKRHGVWFDADELRRVADFVARGGLDDTRREELEEASRELARRRAAAAATPRSSFEASRLDSSAGAELLGWLLELLS